MNLLFASFRVRASSLKEAWAAFGDAMAYNLSFFRKGSISNADGLRYAKKHYRYRPKRYFDHHEREDWMFP